MFFIAPYLYDSCLSYCHILHIFYFSPPPVIVGGGLAGLSAAIELVDTALSLAAASGIDTAAATASPAAARAAGLPTVILLEKESALGGNSAKASSGQNAVGTPVQIEYYKGLGGAQGDSVELFVKDTLASCASNADNVGSTHASTSDNSGAESHDNFGLAYSDPAVVTATSTGAASNAGDSAVPASMRVLVSALVTDSAAAVAFLE